MLGFVYLQLGHVACSSLRRESARRWIKQPAHIKCPLVHCVEERKKNFMDQSKKRPGEGGVGGGIKNIYILMAAEWEEAQEE